MAKSKKPHSASVKTPFSTLLAIGVGGLLLIIGGMYFVNQTFMASNPDFPSLGVFLLIAGSMVLGAVVQSYFVDKTRGL
jgi:hypothetical protein